MNAQADARPFRVTATALAAAGILFVAYPAIRPFSDESTLQGARAFASTAWIMAHELAMLGFIGLALGLLGLHLALRPTRGDRLSFYGLVACWIGAGLTLTFYGAEAFGLHVIGTEALREHRPAVLILAEQIRHGPGLLAFVTGLLLLAAGVITMAAAVWRSGTLPRWSVVPLAAGIALFLPQFVASQPIRVAHGLMVAAGCWCIATVMWGHTSAPATQKSSSSQAGRPTGQTVAGSAAAGRGA